MIEQLVGTPAPFKLDARISSVVALIKRDVANNLSARYLAAQVDLSEPRLSQLFKDTLAYRSAVTGSGTGCSSPPWARSVPGPVVDHRGAGGWLYRLGAFQPHLSQHPRHAAVGHAQSAWADAHVCGLGGAW